MSLQGDESVKSVARNGKLPPDQENEVCGILPNGKESDEGQNVPDDLYILVNISPALDRIGRDENELLAD